jgi:hypothetical protein
MSPRTWGLGMNTPVIWTRVSVLHSSCLLFRCTLYRTLTLPLCHACVDLWSRVSVTLACRVSMAWPR